MYKKIEKYLQERTQDNWGAWWHFFICYWWSFAWTYFVIQMSTGMQYAIVSLVGFFTYFVMIVYEKNQLKNKVNGKRDMIEDVIFNHFGFFAGTTSLLGLVKIFA